jgi:hypothetical protein
MTQTAQQICKISGLPATHRILCGAEIVYGSGEDNVIKLAGQFYQQGKKPVVEPLVAPVSKQEYINTMVDMGQKLLNDKVVEQKLLEDKVNEQIITIAENKDKIKKENVARALKDDDKLDQCGFPKPDTFFAVGTPLAQSGVDAFRRERQQFDKLPLLVDGVTELVKKIKSEDRFEVVIPVKELSASDDLKVKVPGLGEFYLCNIQTLQALMDQTPVDMTCARYLSLCPPELRAKNINHWLQQQKPDKMCKLRLRNGRAGHEIFAVVSKHYACYDAHKAAELFTEEAPKDARVEIIYDQAQAKARIQALFHTEISSKDGVVGEVFKVGSGLYTDDTGGGSLVSRAVAWRALCLNFTNMMVSTDIGRRKHMGTEVIIRAAVKGYIAESLSRIAPFTDAWNYGVKDNVITTAVPIEPEDEPLDISDVYNSMLNVFAGITQRELVPLRGRKSDRIERLMQAWEKEPVPTRVGVVNALTRVAHSETQSSPWDEDDIQDSASDLLFSKKPLPYTNAARIMIKG